jgi:trk system potassium uptake protein TrkH
MPIGAFARWLTPTRALVGGFAGVIVGGAVLQALPWSARAAPLPWIDALFTSTSAVCVTGLTTIDVGSRLSPTGQWTLLLLIQVGGLGITTFSTVFLLVVGRRVSLRDRLVLQDAFAVMRRGDVARYAAAILLCTIAIEGIGTALLYSSLPPAGTGRLFNAAFHAISAFCNAGFSLYRTNLMEVGSGALLVVAALIILGGIGFPVITEVISWLRRGHRRPASLHTRTVLAVTAMLLVTGTVGILLVEWGNPSRAVLGGRSLPDRVVHAFFASVTARTAGYNSIDYGQVTHATLLLTMALMFIGGSPGSCAGGIKTVTAAVLYSMVRWRFRGEEWVRLFNRKLPDDAVSRAVVVTMNAIAVLLGAYLVLLVVEGGMAPYREGAMNFVELLFEAISAFGTVGLSTGITPSLSAGGKLVIILLMFLGRVGPLALALAVGVEKGPKPFVYAEENVLVG